MFSAPELSRDVSTYSTGSNRDIDEDILEELRLLYPDTDEALLEEAARTSSLDEAFEVLNRGSTPMNTGGYAADPEALKAHQNFEKLQAFLPHYDGTEIRALLAGFHNNLDAACAISIAEPELLDSILKNTWPIEKAVEEAADRAAAEEKAEQLRQMERDGKEKQEKRQVENAQRSAYTPPPVSATEWERIGKRLLQMVETNPATGVPHCWNGTHGIVRVEPGEEFTCVAHYLAGSIGYTPVIHGIVRAQNYTTFGDFRRDAGDTIMFHGCRSVGNEMNIAMEGFKIAVCKSNWHGNGNGSWFAYRSNYSDGGGYVIADQQGFRNIFMCLVSTAQVLLNNETMRVVGAGCCVPHWIVTYKRP